MKFRVKLRAALPRFPTAMLEETKRLNADQCRANADECRALARVAIISEDRIMLEHIAEVWDRMAEQQSKRNGGSPWA
jgi:hypothetical protein